MKWRVEFPCGLKYELDSVWYALNRETDALRNLKCPLHGKDCQQKK